MLESLENEIDYIALASVRLALQQLRVPARSM